MRPITTRHPPHPTGLGLHCHRFPIIQNYAGASPLNPAGIQHRPFCSNRPPQIPINAAPLGSTPSQTQSPSAQSISQPGNCSAPTVGEVQQKQMPPRPTENCKPSEVGHSRVQAWSGNASARLHFAGGFCVSKRASTAVREFNSHFCKMATGPRAEPFDRKMTLGPNLGPGNFRFKLFNEINGKWRSRRDSNPRYDF